MGFGNCFTPKPAYTAPPTGPVKAQEVQQQRHYIEETSDEKHPSQAPSQDAPAPAVPKHASKRAMTPAKAFVRKLGESASMRCDCALASCKRVPACHGCQMLRLPYDQESSGGTGG